MLLSATPEGPEFRINTFTAGNQSFPAVAMDADGDFVAVWQSPNQDGDSWGIYAQRYNAAGVKQGGEFQVNQHTVAAQRDPAVAMDAAGNFIVTWNSVNQAGATSGYDIYARRYSVSGTPLSDEFLVNTHTTGTQRDPRIAAQSGGEFVIVWKSFDQAGTGSGWDIYAQRYDASGVAQGSEFRVNTDTAHNQENPNLAHDAAGNFVIVWGSSDATSNGLGVFGQRYDAAGNAVGTEFLASTSPNAVRQPSLVGMNAQGDFVVGWVSSNQPGGSQQDIYARRFNADGVTQGSTFRVNDLTTGDQFQPALAMNADGRFVVAWQRPGFTAPYADVFARVFSEHGEPLGSDFVVNTWLTESQLNSAVAMDADGDFVVVWESQGQDGNGRGVYGQRFLFPVPGEDTISPTVVDVLAAGDRVEPGELLVSAPASLGVLFSEALATSGPGRVTDPAHWSLTRNGVEVGHEITGITFGWNVDVGKHEAVLTFAAPLSPANYVLTVGDGITDVAGNPLDGEFVRTFRVRVPQPAGPEFRVNTWTTGDQRANPPYQESVAADADGNFVVVWTSPGQDGDGLGVFGQRYAADGTPQGSEFQVNTFTLGDQQNPAVAMDRNGDFVVAWTSVGQDGSGNGVYAQRYNADGQAQGSEFRVNQVTANNQQNPSVAVDHDGNFVVAWASEFQDGSGFGVYARVYSAAGDPVGDEFRANFYTTNGQFNPSVAMDSVGNFVISWSSFGQDTSGWGVYQRRFNPDGVPQGTELRVNTYTTGNQLHTKVAMDSDGDFVVTWMSYTQDGSGWGIYGQRYNAAGAPQGSEFRVNTHTLNAQVDPTIAMDDDGDFVITWNSANQDGSGFGIYARRYDRQGTPQGDEFLVNTHTTGDQRYSGVAMDAVGNFVVVLNDNGQDGSGWGVYAQRFAVPTPGLALIETGGGTIVSEHGTVAQKTDTFDVVLTDVPWSNVVLNVVSQHPTEATVSTSTLTFTPGNWNVPQTVTVSGVFDNQTDGDQVATITVSVKVALSDPAYAAVPDQELAVTVRDVANRPVVTGPTGTGQPALPTFTWSAVVPGATSYALWLINKTTGALVFERSDIAAASTSYTLTETDVPGGLAPGEYRFWLNSISEHGYSQSGSPTDFSVGATITPPAAPTGFNADFTGNPLRPQINWGSVPTATSYSLYFIRLADSAVISAATGLTTNSFTPAADLTEGNHRIWVKAHNAAGSSAWSTPYDFTVGAPLSPPSVPTGFSLTNGETTTPTIHWGAVPNAATYSIYFIRLADSTVISAATGLTSNSFTPGAPLSPGGHRIWVKAHNLAGSSAWSAPYDFTIGAPLSPPTAPTGFSVLNADTANPTVTWESQGAGVTYSIWFINLDTGAVVSGATGLTTNSFTASGLTTNRYRIWVKAHNAAGSSSWSSPFDFDVAAP
jgi:hypothetical protein